MSAITGSGEPFTISLSASAASWSGTAGRTISQPASLSSWIWRSVALTSRVSVLVIVWTAMGAAPPMTTPPTLTGIALRRVTTTWLRSCQPPTLEVELHRPVEGTAAQHLNEDNHDPSAIKRWKRQKVGEAERH